MNTDELDALEALARKATPGPWMAGDVWVFTDPIYPDDRRLSNVLGMKFADEDRADAEHERGLRNAEFIAAANPATVLALIADLRTTKSVVKDYDTNFPCDGGCNVNDGPEETCSRHGRSPGDLWNLLDQARRDLRRAQECIEATKNMLGDEKRNPAMRLLGIAQAVIAYDEGKDRWASRATRATSLA